MNVFKKLIKLTSLAVLMLLCNMAYAQDQPDSVLTVSDTTGGFCPSLKAIIESSKNAFEDIKDTVSEERNDFFGRVVIYRTDVCVVGASSSCILNDITHVFISTMASDSIITPEMVVQYELLVQNLKECLGDKYKYTEVAGGQEGERIFKAQSNMGSTEDFYEPNISIKLEKAREGGFQLTIEVAEPFFKLK